MSKKTTKAKPGTAAELAEMYPVPKEITVRVGTAVGEGKKRRFVYHNDTVVASTLPLEQLGGLIGTLRPLVEGKTAEAGFWTVASEHRKEIYAAFAQATGWPAEEVGSIHPADMYLAMEAIVQANIDFFLPLLDPAALEILGRGAKMSGNGAGATPSVSFVAGDALNPSASPIPNSLPQ